MGFMFSSSLMLMMIVMLLRIEKKGILLFGL